MSGFSSVIGFMFTFFMIMGVFLGSIYLVEKQIITQTEVLDSKQFATLNGYSLDYDIISLYNSSGRSNFYIKNQASSNLKYIEDNNFCFDFFLNNKFFEKDNIYLNTIGASNINYKVIEENDIAVLSLINSNYLTTSILKSSSCEGNVKEFYFDIEKIDWWDSNWDSRKRISFNNIASSSVVEYQAEIDLNSSNIDFQNLKEEDLRFILPLKDSYVLDITFDNYNQQLLDYSKYSNDVYLGSDATIQVSDPQKDEGVLFDALTFDGDDFVRVLSDSSLQFDKELTYSAWIKWNGTGDLYNSIFGNGGVNNVFGIVNDATVNQDKLFFGLNIGGVQTYMYSNSTIDTSWHHVVSTYDGNQMKIYIDGTLQGNLTVQGDIIVDLGDNYIGSRTNTSYFFTGLIDEVKILDIALTKDEVTDLYNNNLRFRELEFYTVNYDNVNEESKIFVKLPYINSNSNMNFQMYYSSEEIANSFSDVESVFSYKIPRTVGYIISDKISTTTGLNIFSLYDDNIINIGDDIFNLNEQQGTTLGTASIDLNDSVKMKYLGQVEGNGDVDDMIVPISWASKEFYFRGFRNTADRFCMISPWGDANVEIRDAGAIEWSGVVTSVGLCITNDIATNNVLALTSDIPVLVSYTTSSQDSFSFYPAVDDDLYGVPSQTIYVAAGPLGANINWYESDGDTNTATLGVYGTTSQGGNGPDGNAPAFKIQSDNLIGAIQQADGDGSESTVFVPDYEFGTLFGSYEATDYVAVVSNANDANCSVYNSVGALVGNQLNGVGVNGVYKYDFGTGNDNQYVSGGWKIVCSKPVWPYYENRADNDDETNLFGHLQMRQYIYPEPVVIVN